MKLHNKVLKSLISLVKGRKRNKSIFFIINHRLNYKIHIYGDTRYVEIVTTYVSVKNKNKLFYASPRMQDK